MTVHQRRARAGRSPSACRQGDRPPAGRHCRRRGGLARDRPGFGLSVRRGAYRRSRPRRHRPGDLRRPDAGPDARDAPHDVRRPDRDRPDRPAFVGGRRCRSAAQGTGETSGRWWKGPTTGWPRWRRPWWGCCGSRVARRVRRCPGRTPAAHQDRRRRGQVLRRAGDHQQPGAEPPLGSGPNRPRPTRGWLDGQSLRVGAAENWLGTRPEPLGAADARAALVRFWLARFGPATVADVVWWTGWTGRTPDVRWRRTPSSRWI